MHPALERVVQAAHSDDLEVRDRAVGQIGLLLEKNAIVSGTLDAYQQLMDADLFALPLADSEQHFVVTRLCMLISSEKITAGMLWALGKARRDISIRPLLELLRQQSQRFHEEAMYQSLIALDNVIRVAGPVAELQEQNRLIDEYDIMGWLERHASYQDPRVQKVVLSLMAAIREAKTYRHSE